MIFLRKTKSNKYAYKIYTASFERINGQQIQDPVRLSLFYFTYRSDAVSMMCRGRGKLVHRSSNPRSSEQKVRVRV